MSGPPTVDPRLLVVAPTDRIDPVLAVVLARLRADGWAPVPAAPAHLQGDAAGAVVDVRALLAGDTPGPDVVAAVGSAAAAVADGGAVVVLTDAAVWSPLDDTAGRRPWLAAAHAAAQDAAVRHGPRGVRVNAAVVGGLAPDGPAPLLEGDAAAGVAGAVSFLLSDAAGFVTGETVAVAGGAVFRR